MANKMGAGGNSAADVNSVHGQVEQAIKFSEQHGGLHHTFTGDLHHGTMSDEGRFNLSELHNESVPTQKGPPSGLANINPLPGNSGGGRKEY